jgi:plastocyanin
MRDSKNDWRFIASLPAVAAAAVLATHLAFADAPSSTTVTQQDIAFHPNHVEIKAGGTVTFVNQDPFGHNVYSESPGGEFDLGRQKDGQKDVVTFKKPGTFIAECRIHPKMRLEIVVTP